MTEAGRNDAPMGEGPMSEDPLRERPLREAGLVWTLARRELRGGIKGFRVFLACIILGVAAIAAVGGLSQSMITGLKADGATLLGGDVDLRLLHRPAGDGQRAHLVGQSRGYSEVVKMRAMVRPAATRDKRAMVELKAVDGAYPLVGSVETVPPLPPGQLIGRQNGVWGALVDENLLTRLGVAIGDRVRLGELELDVRGTVIKEPDRVATVFSFGPRLLVSLQALEATGLVQPGSQIRYHHRLLLPEGRDFESWKDDLIETFPDAGWRIRSTEEAAPGVQRFIDRMTLFLSFVGLTILLVGGVGITGAVRSYVAGRVATIATLKCIGAPGYLVFRIYMLQVMVLSLLGVLIGEAIGIGAPWLLIEAVKDQLPVKPVYGFYWQPAALAAVFGLLAAATFALWPVAKARDVKAGELFRSRISPPEGRPQRGYVAATVIGILALAVLTIFTANDRYFAYWFVGGALVTVGLLRGGAQVVMKLARRIRPAIAVLLRLAQANLYRRGAATPGIVTSLGLGLTVLVAITLIEGNMSRQIEERLPDRAPAFFFIDIQPDQTQAFDQAVTGVEGTSGYRRVPSLRGRIVKIDGVPVEEATVAPESGWAIRGDRALTYAVHEEEVASKVTAGTWWPADYAGPPAISLDAGLARGFGIGLGDTLSLNVLGREITAEVMSLREIDWRSLRFDFAIVFAPGLLETAPHSHIAAIEAPVGLEDAVEKAATDPFPNISAIRVRDALDAAARILAGISAAVTGTAALTLVAGAIVLAGVIASEHQRRVYDAVVFKVLGATRPRIVGLYLIEYGMLGLFTGAISAGIGTLTAWAVIRFLMRADWIFLPHVVGATTLVCIAVTLSVGLMGTWIALGEKASGHLRNE